MSFDIDPRNELQQKILDIFELLEMCGENVIWVL